MLIQLALATLMVAFTVVLHGAGLQALARTLRLELQEEAERHEHFVSTRAFSVLIGLVIGLFALHGIEIWLYAALYLWLGAVANLEAAVYFSTITYGAIGYSDTAMAVGWRLVSAIEGINGILLIGWSTAFFVTLVARMGRR